jgi:hypothetical protein
MVEKDRVGASGNGRFHIRIGEHNVRRFAPEFQGNFL